MSRGTEIDVKTFMKQQRKIPVLSKNYVYLSPKQYAVMVNSHPVTVYGWLAQGKVDGAIKVGRCWKIPVLTT